MEFLLMTDDMIDPSSFPDEETIGIGVDWDWNASNGTAAMGKKRIHFDDDTKAAEKNAKMARRETCSSSLNSWQQVEDLANNLAAGLDGSCSLSGLGVDLNSSSYISDALLSVPSLTVFKQELPSPTNHANGATQLSPNAVDTSNSRESDDSRGSSSHMQQLYVPYDSVICQNEQRSPDIAEKHSLQPNKNTLVVASVPATSTGSPPLDTSDNCRFQYVLAAATSITTKINEETLTYLNQRQSYEIKLKKLGDLTDFRGKILKSVIRLCFHERRLQYMEKEQIAAWEASRPGDRILEVDLPLSYGMFNLVQDPSMLNTVEFLWDPTKEVGVYIKVNCISTEFTPNKHGGEKGVPFRIQVDTYTHSDKMQRYLHSASCQIKVFKLKGGDRKHKQDREKILKRPLIEQEKYQPSYECTVLSDLAIIKSPIHSTEYIFGSPNTTSSPTVTSSEPINGFCNGATAPSKDLTTIHDPSSTTVANVGQPERVADSSNSSMQQILTGPLPFNATAQQTSLWLQNNRFNGHLRSFSSFSGADLLRLSRDDLIQICGLADGIRLFNVLHTKAKTLYFCVQTSPIVYHAIYLASLSSREIISKLSKLLSISINQVHDVYLQGPGGIHVLVSDELVQNIKDEAMFMVEILPDHSSDRLRILLKPPSSN
uniref:Grh/CP2 DB domain-containing protein n=1 Tax=Clastoptera arizonana TaxID=38151 RepID=A0A1B6DG69_9HEMI